MREILPTNQLSRHSGAVQFEVLAVSGGRRTGDTYELTPLPEPGDVELPFLVHGIRHLAHHERAMLGELPPGDLLSLAHEPTNPFNERALLVTRSGARLGYVPDPLVEYVHALTRHDYTVTVERVNPPEAGFHMRLRVVLRGVLDADAADGC